MTGTSEHDVENRAPVTLIYPGVEPSVHGLNLVVPEDAKAIIKPWAERNDNVKYAESNVDDQVSNLDSNLPPWRSHL